MSVLTTPYLPSDLSTGLKAYWPLNSSTKEASATPAFDSTGAAEIMSNVSGSERGFGAKFNQQNQYDFEVGSVVFRLKKFGTPSVTTARLVARIYSVNTSGLPDTLLAESTTQIHPDSGLTTSYADYTFSFAAGFNCPRKAIVMVEFSTTGYTASGSNYVSVGQAVANGDGVPQNRRIQKSGSDVYTDGTGNDLYFKILDSTTTDTILTDKSGNAYTLTNNNAVFEWGDGYWGDGKSGARFKSASSMYLSIADPGSGDLDMSASGTDVFTFACFVRHATIGTTQYYAGKGGSGYQLLKVSNDALRLYMNGTEITTATGLIKANRWYHLAFVYDRTSGIGSIYVNGKLETTGATASIANNANAFQLGSDGAGASTFDGTMRDAAFWKAALTPSQINSLALGINIGTLAYRPSNVPTSPTAYWKLNEISLGTGAISRSDSSGNSHTLTDNNTVGTGRGYVEGAAASFLTANSESLSAADSADWNFGTGDFSIALRFRPTIIVAGTAIIAQTNSSGSVNERWNIVYSATNIKFANLTGGVETITVDFACVIKTDVWYHACVTRSGNTFKFFLDGVLLGTVTDSSAVNDFSGSLFIGKLDVSASEGYFNGMIEEVAIWKGYALTDAEAKSLACGLPIQQSGLVSYWILDEASGNRVDQTGRNDCITSNSPSNRVNSRTGRTMLDLNGTNQLITPNTDQASKGLENGINFSIFAWYQPDAPSGQDHVASKGLASTTGDWNWRMDGVNNHIFEVGQTGGLNNPSLPTVAAETYFGGGVWFGNGARLYVEGPTLGWRQTDEGVASKDGVFVGNEKAFIIGAENGPASFFDGGIGDMTFWSRILRDEEAKAIFLKGVNNKSVTSTEIALTTVKKVSGVSYASIKKISGVAIASVKKVAGVA